MRGEDGGDPLHYFFLRETPPQAWGRLGQVGKRFDSLGNTPTGVGKTKYDRAYHLFALETPPQAWGRRWHDQQ